GGRAARLNFFADTTNASPQRVLPSAGQEVALQHRGTEYRVEVCAVGGWTYRLKLDGRSVRAVLREDGAHGARLAMGGDTLRVLYDARDSSVRVEVEGQAHSFGWGRAGEGHAATPAMVVAGHVGPRDRVRTGEALGLLEAMKVEIAFESPVDGVVREVRVRRGQQVAAGDVLLVIEATDERRRDDRPGDRLRLPDQPDPFAALLVGTGRPRPDLAAADAADAAARRAAIQAAHEEIRRVLIGYDVDVERGEMLAAFLEAPLPAELSVDLREQLADVRHEVAVFADIEALFERTPRLGPGGAVEPSNGARFAT